MTETTGTVTLTEFLLARITEDEAAATGTTWAYPANVSRADHRQGVAAATLGMGCPTCKARPGEECVAMGNPRYAPRPADQMHGTRFTLGRAEYRRHNGVRDGFGPARVLAECDAKRRIVALAESVTDMHAEWETVEILLALPYADHPDYREEWRP